jgi:hypothetical protein
MLPGARLARLGWLWLIRYGKRRLGTPRKTKLKNTKVLYEEGP